MMPETTQRHRALSRLESAELVKAAFELTGVELKRPEFGSAANISGVRSRTFTFSRRHDSRTVFASDTRYGHLGRAGAWTGADRTAVAACRRVLRAARVPGREVVAIGVLMEWGTVAEHVDGEAARVDEPELLRKLARAQRAVDGLAVWSSYATVGLTADGHLGWLELHWPELTSAVLKEAALLRDLVRRGFEPPTLPDARVESVEAGVLHSPAIGFFMDVTPAVRVAYAGKDPTIGRKPTLYLDRSGNLVTPPRDIRPAEKETRDRPSPANARG
jgi:hypothetical protein